MEIKLALFFSLVKPEYVITRAKSTAAQGLSASIYCRCLPFKAMCLAHLLDYLFNAALILQASKETNGDVFQRQE